MSNQLLMRRMVISQSSKGINYIKLTSDINNSIVLLTKIGEPSYQAEFEYSLNGGGFLPYIIGTQITLNRGQYVKFRIAKEYATDSLGCFDNNNRYFVNTYNNQHVIISGSPLTLLRSDYNNLTKLGDNAFFGIINNLDNIDIPDNIVEVGVGALRGFNRVTIFNKNIIFKDNASDLFYSFTYKGTLIDWLTKVTLLGTSPLTKLAASGGSFICNNGIPDSFTLDFYPKAENLKNIPFKQLNITTDAINSTTSILDCLTVYIKAEELNINEGIKKITGIERSSIKTLRLPSTLSVIHGWTFTYSNITNLIFQTQDYNSISFDPNSFRISNITNIYVPYSADHSILNAYRTRFSNAKELDENGEIPS